MVFARKEFIISGQVGRGGYSDVSDSGSAVAFAVFPNYSRVFIVRSASRLCYCLASYDF